MHDDNDIDYGCHDEFLCKEIKIINDILTPLASSYRLLVGGAAEINNIALAHRKDVEEAVDRADELGHIIDEVQEKLKRMLRLYFKELDFVANNWNELGEEARICAELRHKLRKSVNEKKNADS